MTSHIWYKKYLSKDRNTLEGYLDFFDELNEFDWVDMLRNLLSENPSIEIYKVFFTDPSFGIVPQASETLERLSTRTLRFIGKAIDVFTAEYNSNKDTDPTLVGSALKLATLLAGAISPDPLMNIMKDNKFPVDLRSMAASALLSHVGEVPNGLWYALDLEKEPEFTFAYVTAMSQIEPKNALEIFSNTKVIPDNKAGLECPLRMALNKFIEKYNMADLAMLYIGLPDVSQQMLDSIFELDEFQRLNIIEYIESVILPMPIYYDYADGSIDLAKQIGDNGSMVTVSPNQGVFINNVLNFAKSLLILIPKMSPRLVEDEKNIILMMANKISHKLSSNYLGSVFPVPLFKRLIEELD